MAVNPQDDFLLGDFEAGNFKVDLSSPLSFAAPGFGAGPDAYSPSAPGTVSPKDLICPPSATHTDLSTPSFESPGSYSQGPSPMFQEMDAAPFWDDPLLFGDSAGSLEVPAPGEIPMAQAPEGRFAMSPPSKPAAPKASPLSATGSTKISSVAGVSKRAPPKPLPPVEFDPTDAEAARRARNTQAARKSRAKKAKALADAEQDAQNAHSEAEALRKQLDEALAQVAERDAEIARLKAQCGAL